MSEADFGGNGELDAGPLSAAAARMAGGAGRTSRRRPALHSECAGAAVLRRTRKRSSERLAVIYAGREVRTEFVAGTDVLWSGVWGLDLRVDGLRAAQTSDWRETVWVSDRHADYLEVASEWEGGLRVERHMLLARKDRFLLMADSLMAGRPGRIEYRGLLPLGPGARFEPADQTHEGLLAGRKRRALVLPLGLPEWRCDPEVCKGDSPVFAPREPGQSPDRPDGLVQTAAGLELRQSAAGAALMAPLFLDLDPKRLARRCTWRRLTVGESLRPVPRDVAVGYRVAVHKDQWLLYRSLGAKGNRTVLGQNFASEMAVARFLRSGEHKVLVELE